MTVYELVYAEGAVVEARRLDMAGVRVSPRGGVLYLVGPGGKNTELKLPRFLVLDGVIGGPRVVK